MTTLEAPSTVHPAADAWARWFVERWCRRQGSPAGDFDRFLAAHPIPPDAHEAVRDRARELLLSPPFASAPVLPWSA
jgi:hypothetical protein